MANPEHLAILKQGVEVWNKWRMEHKDVQADLSAAALNRLDLKGINFENAVLVGAGLRRTNLSDARLTGADLSQCALISAKLTNATLFEANLRWSDLNNANFSGAYLAGADLSQTDLTKTKFNGANLFEAIICDSILNATDFTNAFFANTTLATIDLSLVTGLKTVHHHGPSSVGIDTIFFSKGKIPYAFLSGAGVPEGLIQYFTSLFAQPVPYYSCFISHSSVDQNFCKKLYDDLKTNKVRVWYFPEDAKMGRSVWGQIDQSIRAFDKLLVVCSANSMQSGPVNREIERALQREDREGKHVLFPISLDDYIFKKWKHERKADVTKMFIGDFTKWEDPVAYKKAFDKLLDALQAEDKKTKKKA